MISISNEVSRKCPGGDHLAILPLPHHLTPCALQDSCNALKKKISEHGSPQHKLPASWRVLESEMIIVSGLLVTEKMEKFSAMSPALHHGAARGDVDLLACTLDISKAVVSFIYPDKNNRQLWQHSIFQSSGRHPRYAAYLELPGLLMTFSLWN